MSWELIELKGTCSLITDGAHWSPKDKGKGFSMASVKDMTDNGFDFSSCKRISLDDFEKLQKANCCPKNGDVLIAKDGSYLKHCFEFKGEENVAILSSIAIFRPIKEIIIGKFLEFLFRTPYIKSLASGYVSGVAVPRIVLQDFKTIKLPVPSLPTQQKIASILGAYDDLIENNLKRIQLLEEAAQNLYKEWFVNFRFPGHEQAVFDEETGLPEGWKKKELREISSIKSSKRIYRKDYVNKGIPFYRGKEITLKSEFKKIKEPFFISEEKYNSLKNKFGAPGEGDILITSVGTIGNVYRVTEYDNEFYFKDGNLIWITDISLENSVFLINYLKNDDFKNVVKSISIGSSQKAFTINSIRKLKVLVPNNQIILTFFNLINPILKQQNTLANEISNLKEARDLLLPRLMNRDLDV